MKIWNNKIRQLLLDVQFFFGSAVILVSVNIEELNLFVYKKETKILNKNLIHKIRFLDFTEANLSKIR